MGWAAACCCAIWRYAMGRDIAVVDGWPWLTEASCERSIPAVVWCCVWLAVGWMWFSLAKRCSSTLGARLIPPGPPLKATWLLLTIVFCSTMVRFS